MVAPSQIGSIAFAAERFGTRLAVVPGHSICGAVRATLEEPDHRTAIPLSIELTGGGGIVDNRSCRPARCIDAGGGAREHPGFGRPPATWFEHHMQAGLLDVVAAEYSLQTGVVAVFENV